MGIGFVLLWCLGFRFASTWVLFYFAFWVGLWLRVFLGVWGFAVDYFDSACLIAVYWFCTDLIIWLICVLYFGAFVVCFVLVSLWF